MEFSILKDKVITEIRGLEKNSERVEFETLGGQTFLMHHVQGCCEGVSVEDICGDIDDLLNNPILMAEEVTSSENPEGVKPEHQDSFTWTFYKLATIKGSVTIRWYGQSNGYYSESVDFDILH